MQLYTRRELQHKFQLTEDEFNTSLQKTKCFVFHHSMEIGTLYDKTALFYLSNIEKFLKYHFPIEFAIEKFDVELLNKPNDFCHNC